MMRGSRVALYSPKNDPSTDVLPAGRVLLVTVRPVKLLKIAEPVWPAALVTLVVRLTPENCVLLKTLNASRRNCT